MTDYRTWLQAAAAVAINAVTYAVFWHDVSRPVWETFTSATFTFVIVAGLFWLIATFRVRIERRRS